MSFGILNVLGIVFIVVGAAFLFSLIGAKQVAILKTMQKPLTYGAGIGCLIGGFVMLFRSGDDSGKGKVGIEQLNLKKLLK